MFSARCTEFSRFFSASCALGLGFNVPTILTTVMEERSGKVREWNRSPWGHQAK
jgi:hypothetical protein